MKLITKALRIPHGGAAVPYALAPKLAARAEACEKLRRLPDDTERDRRVIPLGRRGDPEDIAGAALFLLTSSSSVVLVRNGRLLLLPTPYRDAHGEVDLGLQRGKPLSLDEHEYLGLTRKWLAMSFDDTAKGDEADQMF